MAPRQPRSNPQPPNRDRTRARGRLSNIDDATVYGTSSSAGSAWIPSAQEIAKRNKQAAQKARAANPARFRSQKLTDDQTEQAKAMAREGDDSVLLPYKPTPTSSTSNPRRPRTLAAGYDSNTQTLRVRFRDSTPWEYHGVPRTVWKSFTRVKSPGRFINRRLNNYPYGRGDF